MEQPLVTLVAVVVVAFCKGGISTDDFCLNKSCPEYRLVDKYKGFVERRYAATEWITIKMGGNQPADVIDANLRLKNSGYEFHSNAQPVLVTQTETINGTQWFLSWFVPKDTTKPEISDQSVTLQSKPAATIYVRVFDGTPTLEWGLENAKILQSDLKNAEKAFDSNTLSGADYGSYLSLYHHNEIWIYAK